MMSKVDRFWSHEAQNIRCVREADYDRDVNAWQERALTAEAKQAQQDEPCDTCDGSGVVHRADGEWMGYCDCASGWLMKARSSRICAVQEEPHNQPARQAATHSEDGREVQPTAVDRDAWVTIAAKSLIDELTKLGQCVVAVKDLESLQARAAFAPDAVVMPERKTWNQAEGRDGKIATTAHNACLDELARLNRHPVPTISEGYALVPIEPTEAMRDAGNIYTLNRATLMRIWADMLDAAQQPTEGSTDD